MPRLSAADFRQKGCDPQGQWCLLYGPEYELKLRLRDGIIERMVPPQHREYAVETVAVGKGDTASLVRGAAQTGSVLTPARVLVVEAVENLSNAEQRELARNLEAAPGTVVILIEGPGTRKARGPGGEGKGHMSAELVKAVAQAGSAVECRALRREQAVAWVAQRCRELGAAIKPPVAALLVERVGTDLGRLAREVEKLSLLAGGEKDISRQHVEQAVPRTPEDNIFAVGDAIGAADADRAVAVLRDLLRYQGVEPATALAFISRQFRLVWQAKVLLDGGWRPGREIPEETAALLPDRGDIRQYLEGRGWLVNRLAQQGRRFSWPQLAHAVRRVLETELALKGIEDGIADPGVALEMLVLDLCRRQPGSDGTARPAVSRARRGRAAP